MKIPGRKTTKGFMIQVSVEPRSARAGVIGVRGGSLKVKVSAPPVGGAANAELIHLLSRSLKIKKTAIRIMKGASSKNKVIILEGMESLELPHESDP